jgi:hypothetical protein
LQQLCTMFAATLLNVWCKFVTCLQQVCHPKP